MAINPVCKSNAEFDDEQAAELSAYRWIAMAKEYERLGLRTQKQIHEFFHNSHSSWVAVFFKLLNISISIINSKPLLI
jgi:hypothetical protein